MGFKEVKTHTVIAPSSTMVTDVATAVALVDDNWTCYIFSHGENIIVIGVE